MAVRKVIGDWLSSLWDRIGGPAGASISADIAAVKTDSGNLVTRVGTPAAGTVAGDIESVEGKVDNIILDTQVRTIQSGVKAIDAAATKYLHIDSGTNGAEILAIIIEGVVGHDWTLDIYVPAADAEAATQAKSLRSTTTYLAAGTRGGLIDPFAIAFDCYLDFTNDGANDSIDQVTVVYRSRAALTLAWEA